MESWNYVVKSETNKVKRITGNWIPKSVSAMDKQKLIEELKLLQLEEMALERLKMALQKMLQKLQIEELQLK